MKLIKNLLLKNIPIKITSLFLGYIFWCMLSASHMGSYWLTVPLCFYNIPHDSHIDAPEAIAVNIQGRRTDLWNLDTTTLAAHIDANTLSTGKQSYHPNTNNLLLPETIRLVHYKPSNIVVNYVKKDSHTT